MSEKTKTRYLKRVTTLCIIMDIIITAVVLFISVTSRYIDTAALGIVSGMWSIELFLGYLIKSGEKKTKLEGTEI